MEKICPHCSREANSCRCQASSIKKMFVIKEGDDEDFKLNGRTFISARSPIKITPESLLNIKPANLSIDDLLSKNSSQ